MLSDGRLDRHALIPATVLAIVRRSAVSDRPCVVHLLNCPFAFRFANIVFRPVSINSRFEVLRFAIARLQQ